MLIETGALAAAGLATAIYRWKREQIRADRDKALAELALKDAKPSERGKIIESLAKTKQFGHVFLPSRPGLGARTTPDDEFG